MPRPSAFHDRRRPCRIAIHPIEEVRMAARLALAALMLTFAASSALAQTAPVDSTGASVVHATTLTAEQVRRPTFSRYVALSGAWLKPGGDFANLVEDGWSITGEGFQFTN